MTLRARLALGLSVAALVAGVLVTWSGPPDARPANPRAELEPVEVIAADLASPDESAPLEAQVDVRLEETRSEAGSRRAIAEDAPIEPEPPADVPFGTLRVQVRSRDTGEPLFGERVFLVPVGDVGWSRYSQGPGKSLVTGDDGRVEFEVPLGEDHVVRAMRVGIFDDTAEASVSAFHAAETREVVLEFPTEYDLPFVGRIVSAETEQPLPGASYSVRGLLRGSADAHGYFEALVPSWQPFWVMADAPGHAGAVAETRRGHESRADALVIRLHRSARFGALVLARDGSPLEGVRVRLSTDSHNVRQGPSDGDGVDVGRRPSYWSSASSGVLEWTRQTGTDGRCSIGDLPPFAPLEVEFWVEMELRRKETDLRLAPGEVHEVVLRIGSGATIAGRLIDGSGEDAEGVTVWLEEAENGTPGYFAPYRDPLAETVTGAGGTFELADVADGTWWVGPAPGGPYPPRPEVVEVIGGVADRTVLLEVTRGLTIEGRVVDSSGAPIERAIVSLEEKGPLGLSDRTDASGEFSLGPVARGSYLLSAMAPGRVRSRSIAAEAGDRGVVVRLEPGGAIRGTLVEGDRGTAAVGEVLVVDAGGARWPAWTREGGRFEVEGLAAGLYHVSATTEGRGFALEANVAVAAGAPPSEVLLRAWPGAVLHLRYAGDRPYGRFQALVGDVVVASGSVKREGLASQVVPAGILRLECSWEGRADPEVRELTLVAGEERELVFGSGE